MENYGDMINRQRKYMLFFFVIFVLGAIITPYQTVFLGLLLGSSISFYNHIFLHKKIELMGKKIVREEKPTGLGTFSRLAAVAFGVIVALRFSEYFNMIALIVGLMVAYLIILIDFIRVNIQG